MLVLLSSVCGTALGEPDPRKPRVIQTPERLREEATPINPGGLRRLPEPILADLTPHCLRASRPGATPTCTTPPCRLCGPQRWNFEPSGRVERGTPGNLQGWQYATFSPRSRTVSPTAGSNVSLKRVINALPAGPVPAGHGQLASMRSLGRIGGDYWDGAYHTGYEGTFWLSSFDSRPSLSYPFGRNDGDEAVMDMVSPEFSIDPAGPNFIHFLAAGGCGPSVDVSLERRVYRAVYPGGGCEREEAEVNRRVCESFYDVFGCVPLAVHEGAVEALRLCRARPENSAVRDVPGCPDGEACRWEPVDIAVTYPPSRAYAGGTYLERPFVHNRSRGGEGDCSEIMQRVRWSLVRLRQPFVPGYLPEGARDAVSGRVYQAGDPTGYYPEDAGYRIRVRDTSTRAHISVDDFWLTRESLVPEPVVRRPLWGFADLHAHLMNELGTLAFDGGGPGIAARALWGSATGPIANMSACNAFHTTNDNLDTTPHQFSMHEPEDPNAYTLCRDICLDLVDEASEPKGAHHTNGGYNNDWAGWPVASGAIHQQMHWSWVKRAWEGGLRFLIATVGNSEVIGFGLVGEGNHAFMSDQDALALQIPAIKRWAASPDVRDWAEIAYTPQDARRIIGAGKLALVLGVELDHVMDDCSADVAGQRHHVATARSSASTWASAHGLNVDVGGIYDEHGELDILGSVIGTGATTWGNLLVSSKVMHFPGHPSRCADGVVEARLNALYEAGVRHVIPMHFSDNMLGGYAITKPLFYASAIFGNRDANPPTLMTSNAGGVNLREFRNDLGETITAPIWMSLDPLVLRSLVGGILPDDTPPAFQSFADALTSRCIGDEGWRAFFGMFTLGGTELGCLVTDEIREVLPWEGVVDTPAMMGLGLPSHLHAGPGEALPSHVNDLGLTTAGRDFLVQMMRRGMLVDVQHASERAKNDITVLIGRNPLRGAPGRRYPIMASHGGVELARFREPAGSGTAPAGTPGVRESENVLSRAQFDLVYSTGSRGIVGIGMQSADAFRRQVSGVRAALCPSGPPCAAEEEGFGVALGSDINGFDWHALPRFPGGAGGGTRIRYASYDRSTNPGASAIMATSGSGDSYGSDGRRYFVASHDPLTPLQMTRDGRVVRTYDLNFDGLAHFGLLPDFLQDVRVLGASHDDLAPVLRSAEATVRMWEEACRQAFASRHAGGVPASIALGCGRRTELRP